MERIGILTSGGDTPGMNAAIRALVKAGIHFGYTVMGIYHGYKGLIDGLIHQLQPVDVAGIMDKGGTIIRTARSMEFLTQEGQDKAVSMIRDYDLKGLVVIGGDGTYRGAKDLADRGVNVIGLPGTIDNDMGYTDFTIGFDTAVNNVMTEIYKIRDTMSSHDRIGVIEVMGRKCGDIALWAGVAGAADLIIVPECEMSWDEAVAYLVKNRQMGKLTSIVMIAEGAGSAADFVSYIRAHTDMEAKAIVPGYIQRGGNPTAFDRILAARMGERAIELLAEGKSDRAVGIRENRIIDVSLSEAVSTVDVFDQKLYEFNRIMARL